MTVLPERGVGVIHAPGLEPLLEAGGDLIDVVEIEPQTFWFGGATVGDLAAPARRMIETAGLDERPALVLTQTDAVDPVVPGADTPVVRLRASLADTGDGSIYRYDREGVLQAVRRAVGR